MSHIAAIMPCRNSGWVLGISARVLMTFCDSMVLLDHASTDDTPRIMCDLFNEFPGRVTIINEYSAVWEEMAHRDLLLRCARETYRATHIVITDDDELPSGNILPRMRELIERTPRGAILQLPWVQLKGSIGTYISSGMWSQQCASTAFPDDPAYHWAAQKGDYQHHHRHPMGKPLAWHMPMGRGVKGGGLMHGQMISERRLRAKQRWYLVTEATRWPGRKTYQELNAMYGPTVHCDAKLQAVPDEWWDPYRDLLKYLDVDAEPWQEASAREMIEKYGRDYFAGLDLFE